MTDTGAEGRAMERDDHEAPMTVRVREIVEREVTVDRLASQHVAERGLARPGVAVTPDDRSSAGPATTPTPGRNEQAHEPSAIRSWTREVDSLGAGVQSTAMYLLACEGRRRRPEIAVFADTGGEPQYVYDHLTRLEEYGKRHDGPPIVRVSAGVLHEDMFKKRSVSAPLWIKKPNGELAFGGRWCTDKYKTRPIHQFLRKWAGVPRGCKVPIVHINLGISTDEATRQKTSKEPWISFGHPLLTVLDEPGGLGWSRQHCLDYLESVGWGETPKSACAFCGYHSDELWSEIKELDPAGFELACQIDEKARHGTRTDDDPEITYFIHRSLIPLRDVSLPAYVPGANRNSVGCSPFGCPRNGSQISLFDADEIGAA